MVVPLLEEVLEVLLTLGKGVDQLRRLLGRDAQMDGVATGLDQRQVREAVAGLLQLVEDVARLLPGVGIAGGRVGALEGGKGAKTQGGPLGANLLGDGLDDLEEEAAPVLDGASPLVGAVVDAGAGELVDEVAVGAVDLDAIAAGVDDVARGLAELGNLLPDVVLGEGLGRTRTALHLEVAAARVLEAAAAQVLGVRGAAEIPQLLEHEAAAGVHGRVDALPPGNLLRGPHAGEVGGAFSRAGDARGLADDEGAGSRGPIGVVLGHDVERGVVVAVAEACKRSHGETLLEGHVAHLERLPELGVC